MKIFLKYLFPILAIIAVWFLKECQIEKYERENRELEAEIERLKNLPPVENVVTVVRKERIRIPCEEKKEIELTKEMCCGLGIGVEFSNVYVRCVDENICLRGDERIEWTKEGQKKFLGKKGLFTLSLVSGYDFLQKRFSLGLDFIEFRNITAGIDIWSDFSQSDIGFHIGYRPEVFSLRSNFSIIAGMGYGQSMFYPHMGIVFHFLERR